MSGRTTSDETKERATENEKGGGDWLLSNSNHLQIAHPAIGSFGDYCQRSLTVEYLQFSERRTCLGRRIRKQPVTP